MQVRDRLVVAVIAAALVLGAVWLLLVSPERKQAATLSTEIVAEQGSLTSAQGGLAAARTAASGYKRDVHAIAEVKTAIPANTDEPGLIRTITNLAGTTVDVHEIDFGGGGQTGSGPSTIGLTFSFNATYASLQNFIKALDHLTLTDGTNVVATGRLFSVDGVALSPTTTPREGVHASVTATAYTQTPGGATGATGATGVAATSAVTTP